MYKNKATWIWFHGDFEIWLNQKVLMRRDFRGKIIPPFWRVDTFYPSVRFRKLIDIEQPEVISVACEGKYSISLNLKYIDTIESKPDQYLIPAGKHELMIYVYNEKSVPTVYVKGETIFSDCTWTAGICKNSFTPVGYWNFNDANFTPSSYALETIEMPCESTEVYDEKEKQGMIIDFGKETFGFVKLKDIRGKGKINIYYGESREEAMCPDECETFDVIETEQHYTDEYITNHSRAYRYLNIVSSNDICIGEVSMLYEYLPVKYRGSFKSSDDRLNRIWDISIYTLHLNTREFFLDGIKRDRWIWSGDAYQSFLMNYYSFFDIDINKRTLIALRGKDPVERHINHIMDYTFYWFCSLYDYYLYTGDLEFIRLNFTKMMSLMDFCLGRRNKEGMMEGQPDDWVFIDWARMEKRGEISVEQLLFCRSLEVMSEFSKLFGMQEYAIRYEQAAADLKKKIFDIFWDDQCGGFLHGRRNGEVLKSVTRYANIFAILLGYLEPEKVQSVVKRVLENDSIQKIKTPYARFYELAALCEAGEQQYVLNEVMAYWGGMLEMGATTFWEEYDPSCKGSHYEMYNRPFGKSLCHAWGASPIYLLGKYYLGVKPLSPGYKEYCIEPNLSTLDWIEGSVPLPEENKIDVYMDHKIIKVKSTYGCGVLRFCSKEIPTASVGVLKEEKDGFYILSMQPGIEYVVQYTS